MGEETQCPDEPAIVMNPQQGLRNGWSQRLGPMLPPVEMGADVRGDCDARQVCHFVQDDSVEQQRCRCLIHPAQGRVNNDYSGPRSGVPQRQAFRHKCVNSR